MQNISSLLSKFGQQISNNAKNNSPTDTTGFTKFKRKEGTLDTIKRSNIIQKAYIFATINNIIKTIQTENYPQLEQDFEKLEIITTLNYTDENNEKSTSKLQIKIKSADRLFATFIKTEKGSLEYEIQQKVVNTNLNQIQEVNIIVV